MSRSSTANNVICGRLPLFCRSLKRYDDEKNDTTVLFRNTKWEIRSSPGELQVCGVWRSVRDGRKNSINAHKMSLLLYFIEVKHKKKQQINIAVKHSGHNWLGLARLGLGL